MSAKTKIVVLHMKELIFTGVLAVVGIILVILLFIMFLPKKNKAPNQTESMIYTPGVYTSSVMLNDSAVDVQVVVDENHINSISLVNLDESMETMYPLVKPALEQLAEQIVKSQSLDGVTYSESNQYTSIVLLNAIREAVKKASPQQ